MKTYFSPPASDWPGLCTRPVMPADSLDQLCKTVFGDVADKGDQAVMRYIAQYDGVQVTSPVLTKGQIKRLAGQTPKRLRQAIDVAYGNVYSFHKSQVSGSAKPVTTSPGVVCWTEARPIQSVGLYVPGGTAPLISTVLMLGIPAQIAGCKNIVLSTPPQADGLVNPAICYAALKVGVTTLVRAGGVQAVAAVALGTQRVPRVDKVFGPGNQYVVAAKDYAQNVGVARDMPAGPSEVMVIADSSANPIFVAADLLSQAEHGSDSQVMLVTTDQKLVASVQVELTMQVRTLPRRDIARAALKNSRSVVFLALKQAIDFANYYAPEHLILSVKNPKTYVPSVTNAGSVFLGANTPESAGDYASGTNHTLPTNGWAKSYSGLSVADFQRQVSFQGITKAGLKKLGPTITELAEAEGLQAHARAVTIRTKAF